MRIARSLALVVALLLCARPADVSAQELQPEDATDANGTPDAARSREGIDEAATLDGPHGPAVSDPGTAPEAPSNPASTAETRGSGDSASSESAPAEVSSSLDAAPPASVPAAPNDDATDTSSDALGPGPAAERAAMARALFARGVEQARAEDFERAANLFARAQALRPAPGIAYNLASALSRLGRLVEASEQLQWVLHQGETSAPMREAAEASIVQLAPRLAYLRVVLVGPAEGVRLLYDGHPLALAVLGEAVPVDPGAHHLAAVHGDLPVASRELELAEGDRREVSLAIPDQNASPALVTVFPEGRPAAAPPERSAEDLSWLLWAGLAAAGVVVGVIVTAIAVAAGGGGPTPVSGTTMPSVLEWD